MDLTALQLLIALCLQAPPSLPTSSLPSMAADQDTSFEGSVDLGDSELFLRCRGGGAPSVVIDAGAGSWSDHYRPVQDLLSGEARVCTYDRAGLGRSQPVAGDRTPSRMADELYRLLHAARIPPPYVLVGHSLGGYTVRIFQQRHPDQVSALVLVDAAHPDQWQRLPPSVLHVVRASSLGLRVQAQRVEDGALDPSEVLETDLAADRLGGDAWSARDRRQLAASILRTQAAEFEGSERARTQVPREHLGELPLVVLTAGDSFREFEDLGIPVAEANAVWTALQAELASLSSDTIQLIRPNSIHSLHRADPGFVADGIRLAIRRSRTESTALGKPAR